MIQIIQGDWVERLRELPDESVQCCVTSPPYWGLRDYGTNGQLGLEKTPGEYVEKLVAGFEEVRRVLRDDGTLWVNLGDCYAAGGGFFANAPSNLNGSKQSTNRGSKNQARTAPAGFKPKDLVGIPWFVAKALQAPHYAGKIAVDRDRVWMAAIVDAEGSICGFEHQRPEHTETHRSIRTGVHITITNTATSMLDEANRIWPASRAEHNMAGNGHFGKLDCFRWLVHGIENKMLFLREIYPYLIVKRKQAIVAYTLLQMMKNAKHLGHTPERQKVWEKRAHLVGILSDLNHQRLVDLPGYCVEPPSVLEDGWYLRSEITWCKKSPMPESVTDRPSTATEKIFLLTKSERYFYDSDAVRNPPSEAMLKQVAEGYDGEALKLFEDNGVQNASDVKSRIINGARKRIDKQRGHSQRHNGFNDRWDKLSVAEQMACGSNMRNYWLIGPEPLAENHFATFPSEIPRKCILAGSRPGNTVLDPFFGSGTTGQVALELGRKCIGIELNPTYVELAKQRTRVTPGLQLA